LLVGWLRLLLVCTFVGYAFTVVVVGLLRCYVVVYALLRVCLLHDCVRYVVVVLLRICDLLLRLRDLLPVDLYGYVYVVVDGYLRLICYAVVVTTFAVVYVGCVTFGCRLDYVVVTFWLLVVAVCCVVYRVAHTFYTVVVTLRWTRCVVPPGYVVVTLPLLIYVCR